MVQNDEHTFWDLVNPNQSYATPDSKLTSPKYGKKSIRAKIVTQMWKGTLENKEDLPSNWTGVGRFLLCRSQPRA